MNWTPERPDDFAPGERQTLWQDPAWSWASFLVTMGILLMAATRLEQWPHWDHILIFCVGGISAIAAIYFGFIVKRIYIGGKFGHTVVRGWLAVLSSIIWLLILGIICTLLLTYK